MKLSISNLQTEVVLAPYTTYKIGGPADFFVEVKTKDELVGAVKAARQAQIPYFILGTGANILVKDAGFRGLVIHNQFQDFGLTARSPESAESNSNFHFPDSSFSLKAGSGAIIADLIVACADKELSGLEHFVGIPSTVGGALWQNLHFLNPDRSGTIFIEEILDSAEILDEDDNIKTVGKDFFKFGYDDSILHHKKIVVLTATFILTPKPKEQILTQMEANIAWRVAKQPQLWEYPSCGSVFKKIEGVGAGRLIDQAGLKGKRLGGAQISEKHANYIINVDQAKAADVLALIELVQGEVNQKTGYLLEPEITIIGE